MFKFTSLQFSMRKAVQRTILALFCAVTLVSATRNNSCGSGKSAKRVQYPFGFSPTSPIRLNCRKGGEIEIQNFKVQNVTADSIIVNLPAQCHREIQKIEPLFGKNYALRRENTLLFQNCSSPPSGCVIPTNFFDERFNLLNCSDKSDNISCFSQESKSGFMRFADVNKTQCKFLLLSMAVDSANNSAVSVVLETARLGWWLSPPCACSRYAKATNFTLPDGGLGCRCSCTEGYEGDGFRDGDRCRKVSDCDASKYMSGTCGGTTRVGVLVAGIIAGASLMSTLALICYCIRRRSYLRRRMSEKRLICEAAGNSSVPLYPYKEVERATNGFSEKQRLGTGAYGTVFAGKLHNDEWVAIKKIRNRDTDSIEQVMNEIKLLSSVNHPNLVRLLGCCIEKGEQILVYEFMPNGTLSQHLQRERGKGLPWTTRLNIATETAHAIAHLHSAITPPIFHRDIKSSNILLDDNFNSKVADFGLSRLGMTEISHISTAPQGTPGYLDPQYHQNFHLSDKSDVYSLGVVLVEIISAMKVVDFSRPYSEVNLAALAIDRIGRGFLDEIIDPFLEPQRDAWTLCSIHKVAELAFRCLAFHRDMRPSMMEVADELEHVRLSAWAPMEDNTCAASSSVASACSSPFNGSEKSLSCMSVRKAVIGSRRLIVPNRPTTDCMPSMEGIKDSSPVSVHDPWLSEQSSPSTNSLLGNVVH